MKTGKKKDNKIKYYAFNQIHFHRMNKHRVGAGTALRYNLTDQICMNKFFKRPVMENLSSLHYSNYYANNMFLYYPILSQKLCKRCLRRKKKDVQIFYLFIFINFVALGNGYSMHILYPLLLHFYNFIFHRENIKQLKW
jgi:hypothetical protein